MFEGFQNVSMSSIILYTIHEHTHTHHRMSLTHVLYTVRTTETKWGLWEPFCVYLRDLLYFSFSHFEDCCVVRGGSSVVLPLSHFSPLCHARWRGEEEKWSKREQSWTAFVTEVQTWGRISLKIRTVLVINLCCPLRATCCTASSENQTRQVLHRNTDWVACKYFIHTHSITFLLHTTTTKHPINKQHS